MGRPSKIFDDVFPGINNITYGPLWRETVSIAFFREVHLWNHRDGARDAKSWLVRQNDPLAHENLLAPVIADGSDYDCFCLHNLKN